ncbi:DNA replication complex GINS protein Psf3 [Tachypleus tridentatus]|uniref:DNA replication complex GINS protein Psf3 n=1 Tax=Tachypleus tridentatus TaxID=6853 RepID=UPI003FD344EE
MSYTPSSERRTNYSSRSMEEYFSVDDILATEVRIPCRFQLHVYKLGSLNPSSQSPDLLPGTKLELPLWLAQALQSRHIVSVELPKVYREAYREILCADATMVDLHELGPYFYHIGLYLLNFPYPDTEEISKMLIETFKNRFRKVMDASQHTLQEESSSWTSRLDMSEMGLFNIGQKAFMEFQEWQARKMEKICTSGMVINHKKRKRAAMGNIV